LAAWSGLGLAGLLRAALVLPAGSRLGEALAGVWGGEATASAWGQAARHGRPWLWAVIGCASSPVWPPRPCRPGRRQGAVLIAGAVVGLLALLGAGFAIGLQGWSFEMLGRWFGPLPRGQIGLGLGGATALLALLVLLGAGLARLWPLPGRPASSPRAVVQVCARCCCCFVACRWPAACSGRCWTTTGAWSAVGALVERLAHDRVWGLSCLAGGRALRRGLEHAVPGAAHGRGHDRAGHASSRSWPSVATARWQRPLNILALLPIITPPFVVGLGLILLFGRAGLVNQFLEWAFGIPPTRWFYGLFGVWLAQMFAFTPIAFMIMRGVVQGIAPSAGGGGADAARLAHPQTFTTVTLPLLKPGLANAFLVGFIESIADFGNPIIVGGLVRGAVHRHLLCHRRRAVRPGPRGLARARAHGLRAGGVLPAAARARRGSYTTVSGKGDAGVAMALPRRRAPRDAWAWPGPWLLFTVVVYVFAFTGGFVQTWGRDYTPTLAHLRTAFDLQWGAHGLVWAGTAWNSLFTTVKLAAIAAPLLRGHRAARSAGCWRARSSPGSAPSSSRRCWPSPFRARCSG
jgi:iron(III) transport system permease protein